MARFNKETIVKAALSLAVEVVDLARAEGAKNPSMMGTVKVVSADVPYRRTKWSTDQTAGEQTWAGTSGVNGDANPKGFNPFTGDTIK